MDPLALSFFLAWAIIRYTATDLVSAIKGVESPRAAERRERAARAHERAMTRLSRLPGPTVGEALCQRIADRILNPPGDRTPGPARLALGHWWADCWEDASQRRQHRRTRARHGQLPRQRAARFISAWLRSRYQPSRHHRSPDPAAPTGERRTSAPRAPRPPAPPDPADDIVDAEIVEDHPDPEPDVVGAPVAPDPPVPTPAAPRALPAAAPDVDAGTPPAPQPLRKEAPMTTSQYPVTSGETLDPHQSLEFVTGIGNVAARLFSEIETSVATLRQRGVTGDPIALLEQMQEAAQVLSGNCDRAKDHFQRHIATQDVVLSDDTLAHTVDGSYLGSVS